MVKYNSLDEVPVSVLSEVKKYITSLDSDTFVIHGLPPELTGGTMARYSRSSTGLRLTLINEFLDECGNPSPQKGSQLMDRVLNAFGDESVGELEGVHVGIENISQLGTKWIEDRRIGGSPIEQSTRYVKYDKRDSNGKWRYCRPVEIVESGLLGRFEQVNDLCFEVYSLGIKRLEDHFKIQFPKEEFTIQLVRDGQTVQVHEKDIKTDDEKNNFRIAYNFTVRCAALDVGRCVLPASTLTQLGISGNGRFFTNVLTYLKSHPLREARQRADHLEAELSKIIPTYIKRNRADPRVNDIEGAMFNLAHELLGNIISQARPVTLLAREDYLDEVVSSSLYPYSNISLEQIMGVVKSLPHYKKLEVFNTYIGCRKSRRDRSGRALEAGYPIVFDLVCGFAEYRDLQRHRMITQQRQQLTTDLGFMMPSEMAVVGLEREVLEVVDRVDSLNSEVRQAAGSIVAEYATLFNHRMRFMMGMNLREFQHLSELRTQPAGHFSYRALTMEMARALQRRDPWTATACGFIDFSDPGNKISRAREQSRIAGKNLASGLSLEDDFL